METSNFINICSNVGMALVFKVGEHEQFPLKPKNFPKCGDYTSDLETHTKFSRNKGVKVRMSVVFT